MAQEFFINSEALQRKVAEILPSQGGSGAGFDLSASTQIVPIVDLTESAEGANVRQDLQTAFSYKNSTNHTVSAATNQNIITNTGYYKVYGNIITNTPTTGSRRDAAFNLYDGAVYKSFLEVRGYLTTDSLLVVTPYDFTVFIGAGESLVATAGTNVAIIGVSRQIATINGELIPLA